jgi:ActD protein
MTGLLIAEFSDQTHFVQAAQRAHRVHYRLVDACTPFPVEEVQELLEHRPSHVRLAMFVGGVAMAASTYGLEYFSAVINYPYNSGGRPLDAWPAFMLVPFATGILLAAICGFACFLYEAGLPSLSHPLFAVEGFDRVSQDLFVLVSERLTTEDDQARAVELFKKCGATWVREVEQ